MSDATKIHREIEALNVELAVLEKMTGRLFDMALDRPLDNVTGYIKGVRGSVAGVAEEMRHVRDKLLQLQGAAQ